MQMYYQKIICFSVSAFPIASHKFISRPQAVSYCSSMQTRVSQQSQPQIFIPSASERKIEEKSFYRSSPGCFRIRIQFLLCLASYENL